jgi:hypothetical protein
MSAQQQPPPQLRPPRAPLPLPPLPPPIPQMPRIVRPGTRRSQLGFEPLAPQAFPVAIQHGTPPRSWNLRFHKYNEADRQLPAAPRAPGPVEPVQRLTGEVANWPSAHRLSGAKIDFEALDPHLVDNIAAWNYQEKRVIEEPPAEAELVQMMRERLASTGAFVDESGYDQVIEQTRPGKPMFIYPKEKTLMPPGFDVFHRGARKSIVPPDEIPVDPLSAPFKKVRACPRSFSCRDPRAPLMSAARRSRSASTRSTMSARHDWESWAVSTSRT